MASILTLYRACCTPKNKNFSEFLYTFKKLQRTDGEWFDIWFGKRVCTTFH